MQSTLPSMQGDFAGCTMQDPANSAVKEELVNAQVLLQQSQGHFDPAKLLLDPQHGSHSPIANYVGPLKVINIPGAVYSVSQNPSPLTVHVPE